MEEGLEKRGRREGGSRGAKPHTPPRRQREQIQECHETRESGSKTEAEDEVGEEEEGDMDRDTPRGGGGRGHSRVGGQAPPRGKRGPLGTHPRTWAPAVAGSLWRLPVSQRQVAPGQGNCGWRFMAVSLVLTRCSVSKLVCHALWNSRATLCRNLGCVMTRGPWQELELQETPRLCPRSSYKDIGRPQGLRDPGQDHAADGPLGDGSLRGEKRRRTTP